MSIFKSLAAPGVQGLMPYQPGKPIEELQREYGLKNIVKLASNENPLGPSPKALAAMKSEIEEVARYPDGNGFYLKQSLAEKLKINTDQITLGNGSNDVLEQIARAFLTSLDDVVFSQYAFAVYPLVTQAVGATSVVAPATNWGHDLQAMHSRITDRTRLVFIANPNNPTGTWLDANVLESFVNAVPKRVIVVVDEAYFEYCNDSRMGLDGFPDAMQWLERYPNLIVTRTFSKAYGLAGLRVGYSVSSAEIADIINRVRQPFNVNSMALVAAHAALSDTVHLDKTIACNCDGLNLLRQGFEQLGLSYIDSVGNFICVEVGSQSAKIYDELLRQGVIVRPVANYKMPNHLRVSVGTNKENQTFLDALSKVVKAL